MIEHRRDVENIRQRAVDLLADPALSDAVDLVAWPEPGEVFAAAAARGTVRYRRLAQFDQAPGYEVLERSGVDPLSDDTTHPDGYESVSQLFDSPVAPDLALSHSELHHKENIGDHGSLVASQATAPFLAAGPGVSAVGSVDGRLRMVDVAPTLAALLGIDTPAHSFDGEVAEDLLSGEFASSVVVFLLDGTNPDALDQAITGGLAPNVAALLDRGTGYTGGVVASFPTATLANHTTALTGRHPGHSGVIHNTWVDTIEGTQPDLLQLEQMFGASDHIAPGVETLHQLIHRTQPNAFTATTLEYADSGADWSTFARLRRGQPVDRPAGRIGFPHLNARYEDEEWYRWMAKVDQASTMQAAAFWSPDAEHPPPTFCWVNLSLTDAAGHNGGPHSEVALSAIAESDARVGEVLHAIESAGHLDRTAVVVMADHGMSQTDPENSTVLSELLSTEGISAAVADETLIYFTP